MTLSTMAAWLTIILFPAAMIYAGIMDILTMKIRNMLVLAVAGAYFVLAPIAGYSLVDMATSVGVAGIVFVVTFGFFAMGWIGGGDAKLATAVALWFGWDHALIYFIYATLAGGLLTLVIIGFRSAMLPASWYANESIMRLHNSKSGIPYGAAFAFAALFVFPSTAWFGAAI